MVSHMLDLRERQRRSSAIVGAGLVALDIIINNGAKNPVFSAGGTCGNVLAGLSFLGWESTPISRVGMDFAAQILVQDLLDNGVNIKYITHEETISTPRIIEKLNSNGIYAKHHFLLRCPTCHAYLPRFQSPKLEFIDDIITKKHLKAEVYLFDRVTASTLKLAKSYRESGALIFFEPINLKSTYGLEKALNLSHIVKYSDNENREKIDELVNNQIMKEICLLGPKLAIQTIGKYGLSFISSKMEEPQHRQSYKIKRIYDSCGAGDWCTVGFLFHLQQLARENNLNLLETLDFEELINSALSFGQILASLSCMFIGARGLSSSIDSKNIMRIVRNHMKKDYKINRPRGKSAGRNHKSLNLAKQSIMDSRICPTCLLGE
jgi:sugar/nucleoside kinase (ribokinase family)